MGECHCGVVGQTYIEYLINDELLVIRDSTCALVHVLRGTLGGKAHSKKCEIFGIVKDSLTVGRKITVVTVF